MEERLLRLGGTKLGQGCISVLNNMGGEVVDVLRDSGVKTRKLEVYASEDGLKACFD